MVIIWRGLGYLVAVIVFVCSLVGNLISNVVLGDGYYDHHKWPLAVTLIISGLICWFLGNYLRKRSDRIMIDKQTGEEIAVNQSQHTLFFIPMHWYAPILGVAAAVAVVMDFCR